MFVVVVVEQGMWKTCGRHVEGHVEVMWKSEDYLKELDSFHHVGPRDGAQITRLGSKNL